MTYPRERDQIHPELPQVTSNDIDLTGNKEGGEPTRSADRGTEDSY